MGYSVDVRTGYNGSSLGRDGGSTRDREGGRASCVEVRERAGASTLARQHRTGDDSTHTQSRQTQETRQTTIG